jgi:hypothetical protein
MASISEGVEQAIMRSLAKDPDERFATAAEFADALAARAVPPASAPAVANNQEAPVPAKKGCAAAVFLAVALGSLLGRVLLG